MAPYSQHVDDHSPSTEGRRGLRATVIAIAVLAGAMIGVGARETIVRHAPPLAGVYAALGLKVNLAGLDFANVAARLVQDGARRVLVIEGDIANAGARTRAIPPLRLALRSGDAQVVYSWTVKPPQAALGQGEKAAFSARLAAPPAEAVETRVDFASDNPLPAKSKANRPVGKASLAADPAG